MSFFYWKKNKNEKNKNEKKISMKCRVSANTSRVHTLYCKKMKNLVIVKLVE
jgi:hypothetical protein